MSTQHTSTVEFDRTSHPRAVAILAGGKSRRMGRDKAELRASEYSWLESAALTARAATPNVCVVGREKPADWRGPDIEFLPDAVPDSGPLGGLVTALRWAKNIGATSVLAMACDTPQLSAAALHWLFSESEKRALCCGLAVRNEGRIEPLFSIYSVACLPLLEARFAKSEYSGKGLSLQKFIAENEFDFVDAPPLIAEQLRNFNAPDDLKDTIYENSLD